MKRITSLILIAVILCSSCLTVFAANQNIIQLKAEKYDTAEDAYVAADSVNPGDIVRVELCLPNAVASIAALRLKVFYDSNTLSYVKNTAFSGLALGVSPFTNNTQVPEQSYVLAYWVKENQHAPAAIDVQGTILPLSFKCIAPGATQTQISVEVLEAYDRDYKPLQFQIVEDDGKVTVTGSVFTEAENQVFQKLLNIQYPDSKADIEAADSLHAGFTAAKQLSFQESLPELFDAYRTAWTRYWALAEKATEEAIQNEVDTFLNNAAVTQALTMTAESVTVDNYQTVLDAYNSYDKLTGPAKTKVAPTTIQLLQALKEAAEAAQRKAEDMQIAGELLDDYIKLYAAQNLWGLSDDMVVGSYQDLMAIATEARAAYDELPFDSMTKEKQEQAAKYLEYLEHILKIIQEEAAKNATEQALLEEIAAFTQQWSEVLKLNAITAGVEHEFAIEMMLAQYSTLSEPARQRLNSQKEKAEQLLQFIQSKKGSQTSPGQKPDPQPGTQTQPSPGKDPEQNGSANASPRKVPLIVIIMLVAMFAGLLSLIFPAALYLIYRKRRKGVSELESMV